MSDSIKSGIYVDISNADYHAHPAISNSYLSRLDKCPAAAKVPQESTAAMTFGSAAHCHVLEGAEEFNKRYAVAPVCDKRTTAGKAIFAEFQAQNGGKEILSVADANTILAISKAVKAHPFAAKLLAEGKAEQSVFWQDDSTGMQMKCRPDWLTNCGVVVDLKTTTDASEHAFTRSVTGYGYHRQAALYLDGLNAIGEQYDTFVFIAVEKEEPYRVEVYTLDADFVHAGRCDYRRLLYVEESCQLMTSWPAFQNSGITEIIKPAWI